MTDPGAAERLAALRSTRNAPKVPHAQAARILTAGVSTSMVFGIVSYMAHSANVHAAAEARAARQQANSQVLAGKVVKNVPPPAQPSVSPSTLVPAGNVPVTSPRVVVVPVPQPARPAARSAQGAPSQPASTSRSSK
jgi:hypothetical protein